MDVRTQTGAAAQRWSTHGWNRPLSWELILRITPGLPRFILIPLHHATSMICFACMPRERAAARRNLGRITGSTGLANMRLAYRLFFNFSRFMVAYTEMSGLVPAQFRHRLIGVERTERAMKELLSEGRGAVVLTMHIGQWDLGLKLLTHFGYPVHVVMTREEPEKVTRYASDARAGPNLRVHETGSSPLLAVELAAALRRGEVVAVQADRAVGSGLMATPFFGSEVPLPTGPVLLAMATGAPVLPAFILLERGRRYRVTTMEPLRFQRHRGVPPDSMVREAMGRVARVMESVVSRHPDQWFNFYDVWDGASKDGTRG